MKFHMIGFSLLFIVGSLFASAKPKKFDICNLEEIYNAKFQYHLSKETLESFLQGTAYDQIDPYSPDESHRLQEDIRHIYEDLLSQNPIKKKIAIMTAGAPGSGKTLLLRNYLQKQRKKGKVFAYTDPDDVALRNMEHTYKKELKEELQKISADESDDQFEKAKAIRRKAYDKWRPGSNAISNLILANLIRQKYGFALGTTATSPYVTNLLQQLKDNDYKIHFIHVSAPDTVRWQSISERDKTFVQTTEKDIIEKGKLLPQRILCYLKFADRIDFYYRSRYNKNVKLAAVWKRLPNTFQGNLKIINQKLYNTIVEDHNKTCKALGLAKRFRWNNSVEKSCKKIF